MGPAIGNKNPQSNYVATPRQTATKKRKKGKMKHAENATILNETSVLQNERTERAPGKGWSKIKVPTPKAPKRQRLDASADQEIDAIVRKAVNTRKITYRHQQNLPSDLATKIAKAFCKLSHEVTLLKLKFRNCGITNKFLEKVLKGIGRKKIQIRALDLSGNDKLDLTIVEEMRNHFQSQTLDLSGIELNEEQLEILGNMKVKVLKLKYSSFKGGSIAQTLAKLLNNGLKELLLVNSKISDQELEEIADLMGRDIKSDLKHLDLSHVKLESKGVEAVKIILNKTTAMDKLSLSDCGLSRKSLEILGNSTKCTATSLNISSNPGIAEEGGVEAAAKLANTMGCEHLDISSSDLTGENIKELLHVNAPKKVQTLLIGENSFQDWTQVGQLVVKWRIKCLDISESRMNARDIKAFTKSLWKHQVEYVDVSHPCAVITEERKEALEALMKNAESVVY